MNVIANILIVIGTCQGYSVPRGEETNDVDPGPILQERWFKQPLNHFDNSDTRTFQTRYFEDSGHYSNGGPVILEVGGEGHVDPNVLRQGQSYEFSKEVGGRFLALEHRYYGKSSPFT